MSEVNDIINKHLDEAIVHHGSAQNFKAFDNSFMGTGEGAQVYGWGTYLTDSQDLGEFYIRNAILNNTQRYSLQSFKNHFRRKFKQVILNPLFNPYNKDRCGYLYAVEIPENTGDNYINWNTSDKKELQQILNRIKSHLTDEQYKFMSLELSDKSVPVSKGLLKWVDSKWKNHFDTINSFERFYNDLAHITGSPKAASLVLNSAGYIGIIVPMSNRKKVEGLGMNYVIFNTDDIKIIKKMHITYNNKMDRRHTTLKDNPAINRIIDLTNESHINEVNILGVEVKSGIQQTMDDLDDLDKDVPYKDQAFTNDTQKIYSKMFIGKYAAFLKENNMNPEIEWSYKCETACTDGFTGRLIMNPTFMEIIFERVGEAGVQFIILHETMHNYYNNVRHALPVNSVAANINVDRLINSEIIRRWSEFKDIPQLIGALL